MFNFSLNNIFTHFSKDIVELCTHIKENTQTQYIYIFFDEHKHNKFVQLLTSVFN